MSRLAALLVAFTALLPATAAAQSPELTSPSGIVMGATTGDVVWQKDADSQRPIASATKLMTAAVVLEEADLDRVVTAPRYPAVSAAESVLGLVPGEKISVRDLVRALLVDSSNDAAYTLALKVGGGLPAFVERMNERAAELGLENTSYANPIGLDDAANYSSARDLAILARELRKDAFFRETVASETLTLESGARPRELDNSNELLGEEDWVDGVKTGYTSLAGDVLVASGTRRGIPVISVVLGASDEGVVNAESLELLEWGFSRFERVRAVREEEEIRELPIVHRDGATLPVWAGRTVTRIFEVGDDLERRVTLPAEVEGPISYRQRLGTLELLRRGERIATVPLVSSLKVPEAGVARRAQNFLTRPWTLVVIGILLLLATAVTQRRTAAPGRERTA